MADDEFGDFFGGGEGGGAPAISWKFSRAGDSWTGILLPAKGHDTLDAPAHRTVQQSDQEGNLLVWDDGKPRLQGEIVALTDFRGTELMSERAINRLAENEGKDDGVRRQFIKGPRKDIPANAGSSALEFDKALKAARVSKPQVGATVKQTLVKRVEVGGRTNNHIAWEYTPPTPATLAKVKAYLEAQDKASGADQSGDEPPF